MRDHLTCEDCCREMFSKWMRLRSTPHTWGTILVALSIVGELALADKIALELRKKDFPHLPSPSIINFSI